MAARTKRIRMRRIAGILAILLLLAPASAFAIFPPVTNAPVVNGPVVNVVGDPEVNLVGDPDPIPEAQTPEPATIITGLIGLALGGRLMRREKARFGLKW